MDFPVHPEDIGVCPNSINLSIHQFWSYNQMCVIFIVIGICTMCILLLSLLSLVRNLKSTSITDLVLLQKNAALRTQNTMVQQSQSLKMRDCSGCFQIGSYIHQHIRSTALSYDGKFIAVPVYCSRCFITLTYEHSNL